MNKFQKLVFVIIAVLSSVTLANGQVKPSTPRTYLHRNGYNSGLYFGIYSAPFVFTADIAKFQGSNPSDSSYLPIESTNNIINFVSYNSGLYFGYDHVFDKGFLPYLGFELGLNLRQKYNADHSDLKNGDIYGKQINSQGGLSLDILPGFVFGKDKRNLAYLRFGIEEAYFELDYDMNDTGSGAYRPLARFGIGIEHELVWHFYIRADYVLSAMLNSLDYQPYLPAYNDTYSTKALFNTISVGLTYRIK